MLNHDPRTGPIPDGITNPEAPIEQPNNIKISPHSRDSTITIRFNEQSVIPQLLVIKNLIEFEVKGDIIMVEHYIIVLHIMTQSN